MVVALLSTIAAQQNDETKATASYLWSKTRSKEDATIKAHSQANKCAIRSDIKRKCVSQTLTLTLT